MGWSLSGGRGGELVRRTKGRCEGRAGGIISEMLDLDSQA